MSKALDLSGVRFGRLVAINVSGKNKCGSNKWRCICDCGKETNVEVGHLRGGTVVSCGCYRAQNVKTICLSHGQSKRKSSSPSRLYNIWAGMKTRCTNPKAKDFHSYGGRGITLCPSWHSFEIFYRDMNLLYEKHVAEHGEKQTVIDRIDNNNGYSPENCRWVTYVENNRNRRSNHKLTFNGSTFTLTEWAEKTGIKKVTLLRRIAVLGWSIEKALTTQV